MPVSSDEEAAQRDAVVQAVGLGVAAVMQARYDFARTEATSVTRLEQADAAVTAVDDLELTSLPQNRTGDGHDRRRESGSTYAHRTQRRASGRA